MSLECSSVCVVDGQDKIEREAKVASEPDALIAWFAALEVPLARIGLEAGPLSQWLFAALHACGLAVELLETRHVRDAFKAMPVKKARDCAAMTHRFSAFIRRDNVTAPRVPVALPARWRQSVSLATYLLRRLCHGNFL